MSYHVYLVDSPTLLDDLLEDSARVYHRLCSVIQSAFHAQWLATLGEEIGREQMAHPAAKLDIVQRRVFERLRSCRNALREKEREMMAEESNRRDSRDAAIRAYVNSTKVKSSAEAA